MFTKKLTVILLLMILLSYFSQIYASALSSMIFIKGGSFDMGDTFGKGDSDETIHKTTLSDFYMAPCEVTFDEYDLFCSDTGRTRPKDNNWGRGFRPVININWYDAVEYCNWLSVQAGLLPCYTIDKTKRDPANTDKNDDLKWIVTCDFKQTGFRLPTEAEWEYAARQQGSKVRFGNGKETADPAEINFYGKENGRTSYSIAGEYHGKTLPVAGFKPNSLGLYDMSGNVWEWCWDFYGAYPSNDLQDYTGLLKGDSRVLRGGSWLAKPQEARAADRYRAGADVISYSFGFRIARSAGK